MLYNDYRPLLLDQVVGQDTTIKALKKRFKENNLPRVILLEGITGIGKTTLDRIIGKHILCNNKDEEGNSCNTCEICKAIDNEIKNSFYFEKNCSNMNIDETRELEKDAEIKSFSQSKAKVFVLDEVQEMKKSSAALNSLLKLLEKDNKNCYFILSTMASRDVPPAIRNRCTTYSLKPISLGDISKHLYNICIKEGIQIDNEEKANVLLTITDSSYGSMRSAVSYLERVIDSELWTVKQVIEELEIISTSSIVESINNLFEGKSEALNIQYTKELIDKFRQILSTIFKYKSGVDLPPWQLQQLKGINKNIELPQIEKALDRLFELNKFTYLTQELIDFTLLKILLDNRKPHLQRLVEKGQELDKPKRRGE